MARMSIDDSILRSARVRMLSGLTGRNRRETIGTLLDVWAECYDRMTPLIPVEHIDTAAELDGWAAAMVRADLASEHGDGLVRVAGVSDRIEYLIRSRRAGRKGGLASGAARSSKAQAPDHGHIERTLKPKTKQSIVSAQPSVAAPAPRITDVFVEDAASLAKAEAAGESDFNKDMEHIERTLKGVGTNPQAPPNLPDSVPDVVGVPDVVPEERRAGRAHHPETKAAIDGYHSMFMAARGARPTWRPRDLATMDQLVRAAGGAAAVLERARRMFSAAPRWPVEHGGDLGTLSAHFDRFAAPTAPRVGTAGGGVLAALAAYHSESEEASGDEG